MEQENDGVKSFLSDVFKKEGKELDDKTYDTLLKSYNNDYDTLVTDIAKKSGAKDVEVFKSQIYKSYGFTPDKVPQQSQSDIGPFDQETVDKYPQAKQNLERWKNDKESRFQEWVNTDPNVLAWRNEYKKQYGEEPDLNSPEYDYRGAFEAGITPEPNPTDGKYHWESIGVNGKDLKSANHPTRWKSEYMKLSGKNPDENGISFESALTQYPNLSAFNPAGSGVIITDPNAYRAFNPQQAAEYAKGNAGRKSAEAEKSILTPEDIETAKFMLPQIDKLIEGVQIPQSKPLDPYQKNFGIYGGGVDLGNKQQNTAVTTKNTLQKAKDYYKAVANGDANAASKFWSGLKTIDLENTLSLGIKGMANSIDIYQAAKNFSEGNASKEEETLLIAKAILDEIQSVAQKDRAISVGTGLGEMAPWLAQFAVTGGLGTGVAAATTNALGKSFAAKVAGRLVGSAAQTAAQVPMMGQGTFERMTDRYQLQDTGLTQVSEGEGFGEAMLRTYANNFLENLSERGVGDAADFLATKGVSAFVGSKVFGQTYVADIINWTRRNPYIKLTNRTLGLNTPLSENVEEAFTGLTQPFVTEDNWKDIKGEVSKYFTGENLYRTFLTTAAMGAGMGAVQFPGQVYKTVQSEKGRKFVNGAVDDRAAGLFYAAATANTVDERQKHFAEFVKLTGMTRKDLKPVMHYYQTVLSQIENGIDPQINKKAIDDAAVILDPAQQEEAKIRIQKAYQTRQKVNEFGDAAGNVTTVEIDGANYYVRNSKDLGVPGAIIFVKDADGITKPIPAEKIKKWNTQTPEEVFTDMVAEEQLRQKQAKDFELLQLQAASWGVKPGATINTPFGEGTVVSINEDGTITAQDEAGQQAIVTLDEVQVSEINFQEQLDARIKEAQTRLELPNSPDITVTDDTELTLSKLDNEEPVPNSFLQNASNELYEIYNNLEEMKYSESRLYTIEQIESMQQYLGEEITKLENYAAQQSESGEFVNQTQDGKTAAAGTGQDINQPVTTGATEATEEEINIDELSPEEAFNELSKTDVESAQAVLEDEISSIRATAKKIRTEPAEKRSQKVEFIRQANMLEAEAARLETILNESKNKLNDAVSYKRILDDATLNVKSFADFIKVMAGFKQIFSNLDVETKSRMNSFMLAMAKKPEIAKSIISLIPVDVVNNITGLNLTSEELLNNPSVFGNALSVDSNGLMIKAILDVLDRAGTLSGAEVQRLNQGGISSKTGSAEITNDSNLIAHGDNVSKDKETENTPKNNISSPELINNASNNQNDTEIVTVSNNNLEGKQQQKTETIAEEPYQESPTKGESVEPAKDTKLRILGKAIPEMSHKKDALNALTKLSEEYGVPISIVHSSELPKEVKDAAEEMGVTGVAFYHQGMAYVIVDKITSVADVKESYLHESVLHKGLDILFNKGPVTLLGKEYKNKDEFLREVYSRLDGNLIDELAKEYAQEFSVVNGQFTLIPTARNKDITSEQLQAKTLNAQKLVAEEVLAKLIQMDKIPSRLEVLIDSLWKKIKKVAGLTSNQFTRTDLLTMLAEHRTLVKQATRASATIEMQRYNKEGGSRPLGNPTTIRNIKFKTAWHGSPYEFDKFKLDRIGTGEGAQAFGWGLYFTDKEGIAREYATRLGQNQFIPDNAPSPVGMQNGISDEQTKMIINDGIKHYGSSDKLIEKIREAKPYTYPSGFTETKVYVGNHQNIIIKDKRALNNYIKKYVYDAANRNLYKVKIHGDKTIEELNFLRWDKPMNKEQAEKIKSQLEKEFQTEKPESKSKWLFNNISNSETQLQGSIIYDYLNGITGSQQNTSLFLLRAGIDGIQYPSEYTTKGQHEDSFNYVVFDENAIEIEESIKFRAARPVTVNPNGHKLSLVQQSDIIDIKALIEDIVAKDQKVWFWAGDQLGKGMYYDTVIKGEHYLDAGMSYPLDPANREQGAVWASGKDLLYINNNIKKSDYIFIISGSPTEGKLFNLQVFDLLKRRAGDFATFKKDILDTNPPTPLRTVLEMFNSWDEISTGTFVNQQGNSMPARKHLLSTLYAATDKKKTALKALLDEKGYYVDPLELRDGFLADNNFEANDIMVILKPTEARAGSNHSTYLNTVYGEIVGVPDMVVDGFELMPAEMKENAPKADSQKSQKIAPYGSGIRPITMFRTKEEEAVAQKLSGKWATLTGENPNAIQGTPEENKEANIKAEAWLRKKGYDPIPVKGKYGNEENSFFVEGISRKHALEFAREFKQESVATNEGLLFPDETYNPATGIDIGTTQDDFYTEMDGVRFSMNLAEERIVLPNDINEAQKTQEFFNDVALGISDRYKPVRPWEAILPFTKKQDIYHEVYKKFTGNFDEHISTSIPAFMEVQIKVGAAIVDMFKNGALVYDIGGSQGGFVKAITEESNGKIKTINLDPSEGMQQTHEATPVKGSEFVREAFYEGFEDGDNVYVAHKPKAKADVVHESMVFQFITPERAAYIKEVKDNYLKEGGLFITEEKFKLTDMAQYKANEDKKNRDYKTRFYSPEQINAKQEEVLVGMTENQANYDLYKTELKEQFKYVGEYWDGGNFKGLVATNSKSDYNKFLYKVGNTDTEFSEKNIKFRVNQTDTKKFKDWFGNSQVVDSNGNPLVVYHGTREEFTEFNNGAFFTDDYMNADGYAGGENVIEAFIKIERPLIINARGRKWNNIGSKFGNTTTEVISNLDTEKYDGVIFNNIKDSWIDDVDYQESGTVYYVLKPTQIKSATDNIGTFNKNNPDIRFRTAPVFYSPTEKALGNIQQNKGTAEQFKAMLLKNGAKQAELDWMGWDEFAKANPNPTKTDIQKWIDDNKIEIQEVTKGLSEYEIFMNEMYAKYPDWDGSWLSMDNFLTKKEVAISNKLSIKSKEDNTKFSKYQLPGGLAYKEVLLTMPQKKTHDTYSVRKEPNDKFGHEMWGVYNDRTGDFMFPAHYTEESAIKKAEQLTEQRKKYPAVVGGFTSSHFDEPNILAHIRFNERTDSEGNKVLFIEEIQSDWAQKGKKEGFREKRDINSIRNFYVKKYLYADKYYSDLDEIDKKWIDNVVSEKGEFIPYHDANKVPDMPFKQTPQWVNLALRRMIRYAAENGFDRIAWTNGEQQAERYDLSKQVDAIDYKKRGDDKYTVQVRKGDNNIWAKREATISEIEDTVGKEIASKIQSQANDELQTLSGLDLKVGGQGMKAFYDAIVPNAAKELGKKFGAKVEPTQIVTPGTIVQGNKYDTWNKIRYEIDKNYDGGFNLTFIGSDIYWMYRDGMTPNTPTTEDSPSPKIFNTEKEADKFAKQYIEEQKAKSNQTTVQSLPITESMRTSALTEGMPMFRTKYVPDAVSRELTFDKDGKVMFVHYGRQKYDVLDPQNASQNASNISSREELAAKSTVGGVIDLYTHPEQQEPGTGTFAHIIKVDPDKVYHLQSDPLKLYDVAQARFNEQFPGQAFTPNHQAAWVSKVANERGFDVLITDWRRGPIGKITKPMTPTEGKFGERPDRTPKTGDRIHAFGSEWDVTNVEDGIVYLEGEAGKRQLYTKNAGQIIGGFIDKNQFNADDIKFRTNDSKDEWRLRAAAKRDGDVRGITVRESETTARVARNNEAYSRARERNVEVTDDEARTIAAFADTEGISIDKAIDILNAGKKTGTHVLRKPINRAPVGSNVTPVFSTYNESVANVGQKTNVWVRNSESENNSDRIIAIQFTPVTSTRKTGFDKYYDLLYRFVPGYDRTSDFWEIPPWIARIAAMEPNTDTYIVRNMDEADAFIKEAGYGKVVFSAMDVTKPAIEKLVAANKDVQFDIGTYVSFPEIEKYPNAKTFKSIEDYAKGNNVQLKYSYDYRNFEGTAAIPRIRTSEGCHFACAFCSNTLKVKDLPLDEIMQQVEDIKYIDAKLVYVGDKAFGQAKNKDVLIDIYNRIKEYNPGFDGFIVQTSALDFANRKVFSPEFLQESHIKYVELGIETVNDDILMKLKKPHSKRVYADMAMQNARDNDIKIIPNVIVGLAGTNKDGSKWEETEQTYQNTLDWLNENKDIISHLNIYALAIYNNTEIADNVDAISESDSNENIVEKSFHQNPEVHQQAMDDFLKFGSKQIMDKYGDVKFRVKDAEIQTNTAPTEAQKESGNYKKGHIKFDGFDISIENPKGSIRSGETKVGKKWSVELPAAYGYFRGTVGKDKDHVDVFIGENPEADKIYVVDQLKNDGTFDEHKVMLGFNSVSEARNTYLKAFEPGFPGLGAITRTDKKGLKDWFANGDMNKTFAEHLAEPKFRTQTDTPEFKKWFGDSKVVDENGRPIVAYHGSKVLDITTFESGWFTNVYDHAYKYAREEGRVYAAYLSIKNPAPDHVFKDDNMTPEKIRAKYDGFILPPKKGAEELGYIYVPFFPEQIKSAEENIGTFDATNPDIRFRANSTNPKVNSILDDIEALKKAGSFSKGIKPPTSVNKDVQAAMDAAHGLKQKTFIDKISEWMLEMKQMSQHFKYITQKEFPVVYNKLRLFEAIPDVVKKEAFEVISNITKPILKDKDAYAAFERYVVLKDLIPDLEAQAAKGKVEFRWGYKSIDEVRQDLANLQKYIDANPILKKTIELRQAYMNEIRDALIQNKLLGEKAKDKEGYFHRQVLMYMDEKNNAATASKSSVRNKQQSFQKARKEGAMAEYNTNYLESEFEVLAKSLEQIRIKKILNDIGKEVNIKDKLMADAEKNNTKWYKLIPEGYVVWQPKSGTNPFKAATPAEKIVQNEIQNLEGADELQNALNEVDKTQWVIPESVANQLNDMKPSQKEPAPVKAMRFFNSTWKQWILMNPYRVLKYNLNNTSGDLDIVLAYNPAILKKKYAHSSLKDLISEMKGNGMSQDMKEAMEQGVISSGLSIQEIPDINDEGLMRMLTGEDNLIEKYIKKYWNTTKDLTQFRENLLRLAAYKFFKEKMQQGEKLYGASNHTAIDAIKDPIDKAGKLARELLGDYGNLSLGGQWLRSHLYPFWSWMEVNSPRYFRLLQNLAHEKRTGMLGTVPAILAGKLTSRLLMLGGLVTLWNYLFFHDEDEELSKTGNRQLRLIVGRREDGTIMTIRIQGAFSDVLSFVGLEDAPKDIRDVAKGKATVGKKGKEAASAFFNKVTGGAMPYEKNLFEVISGKTFYPDILNPRPTRDRAEQALRMFSMDKLYNWATKKPMAGRKELANLILYESNPGESAYYLMKQKVSDYLEEQGQDKPAMGFTDKGNALYYYKKALKLKDTKLANHWLAKYAALGGTKKGLKDSIEKGNPLGSLGKYKEDFLKTLDQEDIEVLQIANDWYRSTYIDTSK